jgi:hypothetical protein
MTKDEALKMAIDYLHGNYVAHSVRKVSQGALVEPINENGHSKDEALKLALNLLESMKTGAETFRESSLCTVCSAIEEALEQ